MDTILLSRDAAVNAARARGSLLASADSLQEARRIIADRLERISARLPREPLSRKLVREIAFSRGRTLRSTLRDRVSRDLPFVDVFDDVCDALIEGGVLRSQPATALLRGDLWSAPNDDGRWIFTSDGWCEVSEALWVMLDALPPDIEECERARLRMRRALEGYDLTEPDEVVAQGWESLTRDGLLRTSLEPDSGDPRPVVYFVWDEVAGLDAPQASERMRDLASDVSNDNPYRPHLVVLLERHVDESGAEAIPWLVRRTQLVGFDTASIVWNLTFDARSVTQRQDVAARLAANARSASIETRVLVRGGMDTAAIARAQTLASSARSDLLMIASADATLADVRRVQRAAPAWEVVAPDQQAAVRWLHDSADGDDFAIAMRAILTSKECRLGDTFTLRGGQVRRGCPLGCTDDVVDLLSLRAGLNVKARGEPRGPSHTSRPSRGGRRCI